MQFISRLTAETEVPQVIDKLTNGLEMPFDMGFLFISSFPQEATDEIAKQIRKRTSIKTLLGCSCAGAIGMSSEIERRPACSLILAKFDDVRINPFYFDQSKLTHLTKPEDWYDALDVYPNESPKFLILPDPFLLDMNQFMHGINEAYPNCPVVGGLASGSMESHGNALMLNDTIYNEGLIGVSLTGNVRIETVVSQGCRPIGETYIVTKSENNIIYELAGRPFYEVLEEAMRKATLEERMLAQEALFIGIAMDEYKHKMKRGDFLIRMLIGLDQQTGAGAIADYIRTGQTIQFHVRDAISSTEDLNALLKDQQSLKHPADLKGALVFSCNGRGEHLFREKNHDIGIIQNHIGQVPTAGFFCAGEIGPVGGKNFLHGFTSSIALFYPEKV